MRCKQVIELLSAQLVERNERIAELEDRLMANSLAELRAVRPVAMPAITEVTEDGYWTADPTGLVREFVRYTPETLDAE